MKKQKTELIKPSKYHNIKTNGFDSKGESRRYHDLLLEQKAGLITDLQKQPTFVLQEGFRYNGIAQRPITYKPDFKYIDLKIGKVVYEDYKSEFTAKNPVYRLKVKLFRKILLRYPDIEFIETIR